MTVAIVDDLEPVDVDEGDDKSTIRAARPVDLVRQGQPAHLAPVDAGQLVEVGRAQLRLEPRTFARRVRPVQGRALAIRGGSRPIGGCLRPYQLELLLQRCLRIQRRLRVTMLHVTSLFRGDAAIQSSGAKIDAKYFRADELSSFGMDVHAGVGETSQMLAVRPDLVRPVFKSLPSQAGRSLEELRQIATRPGWQGYLSSPARATAAHGRAVKEWWIDGFTDLMLRAVRGENMFVHARVPESVPPAVAPVLEKALANEAAFGVKLENWLVQRPKR